MYVRALIYVRTNVKSDCTKSNIYIYIYILVYIYIIYIYIYTLKFNYIYIITYGSEVWNRGMEQRYGTDPSQGGMERGYGTGVWNGCGPGACSGPPILTCPHMVIDWL